MIGFQWFARVRIIKLIPSFPYSQFQQFLNPYQLFSEIIIPLLVSRAGARVSCCPRPESMTQIPHFTKSQFAYFFRNSPITMKVLFPPSEQVELVLSWFLVVTFFQTKFSLSLAKLISDQRGRQAAGELQKITVAFNPL